MNRVLDPQSNPPGWIAAFSALYAAGTAIYNAQAGKGPVDWSVVFAAVVAVAALWSRSRTTPVSDPRDGNGVPLVRQGAAAQEGVEPPWVGEFREMLVKVAADMPKPPGAQT